MTPGTRVVWGDFPKEDGTRDRCRAGVVAAYADPTMLYIRWDKGNISLKNFTENLWWFVHLQLEVSD